MYELIVYLSLNNLHQYTNMQDISSTTQEYKLPITKSKHYWNIIKLNIKALHHYGDRKNPS